MGFPANSCGQEAPYKALRLTVYSFFACNQICSDYLWMMDPGLSWDCCTCNVCTYVNLALNDL